MGVGCQSAQSRSYLSQVKRFRYQPSAVFGSAASHREGATTTGAMPAGAARHFCDALKAASTPSLSIGRGSPPREETASTRTKASAAWAISTTSSKGFVRPVEVSLWMTATAFAGSFNADRSFARSKPWPHGAWTRSAFTRWVTRTSRTRSPKNPFARTTTRSPGRRNVKARDSSPAWPGPTTGKTRPFGAAHRYFWSSWASR